MAGSTPSPSTPLSSSLTNILESPVVGTETNKQKTKESAIPEGFLPSFLATAFGELYEEDGLLVLGKGLGWLNLLASFVRFYADVEDGHVAIMLEDKKRRKIPGRFVRLLLLVLKYCFILVSPSLSWF